MRSCALFALVVLLVSASTPGVSAAEPQERPHVLFVAVDELKEPEAQPERAVVMTYGRKHQAVRQGPWRLIRYADGSQELYDHRADPNEWTNLADREDLTSVRENLRRHLPEKNAPSAPRDANR